MHATMGNGARAAERARVMRSTEFLNHRRAFPVGYADIAYGVYDERGIETFPSFASGTLDALPATVDRARFVVRHDAEVPHFTPSMGLNSRNVKTGHNGRKAAKAQLGVTGGYVVGSHPGPIDESWAPAPKLPKPKTGKGRNARRKARRAAVAA